MSDNANAASHDQGAREVHPGATPPEQPAELAVQPQPQPPAELEPAEKDVAGAEVVPQDVPSAENSGDASTQAAAEPVEAAVEADSDGDIEMETVPAEPGVSAEPVTAEPAEPTLLIGAAQLSDATDAAAATEAADVTMATEAAMSAEPAEPTVIIGPSQLADATDVADPTIPAHPTETADPNATTDLTNPTDPTDPTDPTPTITVDTPEEDAPLTTLDDINLAAALSEIPPEDDENHLDPDTLANLAALTAINEDDADAGVGVDEEADEETARARAAVAALHAHEHDPEQDLSSLFREELTREQVQEIVNNLGRGDEDDEEVHSDEETHDENDSEYRTTRTYYENGKLKRRRNRTVLSCTECHRRKQHCDRNIPCSRCIKRGVPSMCRMESPSVVPRKKQKPNDEVPVTFELGLRVQALESLIRSGANVDPDAAQAAAFETVMQATRAANRGQPEAANALAQLTTASNNLGIGALPQDAQNSLLLDVLQQLSAASSAPPPSMSMGDAKAAAECRETWSSVPAAPVDAISQVEAAYEEDISETKLNLTVPGFRENNGKVFLPPTMRHAEKRLREDNLFTPGVLPVQGYEPFLESGTRFAYGAESDAFKSQRIAAIQAVSITGALRLAGMLLARFPVPVGPRSVYVPTPCSDEDIAALREGGLEVKQYRFLDPKTGAADWEGMKEDLQHTAPRSVILLHVSGSTPTGVELTAPQWRMLTTLMQSRQLIPLVIMAFQGLSSGDTGRDAQPLRFMVHTGLPVVLVQTFDAMMGLYADSPSILSIATQNTIDRDRINSQLRALARSMYLHPPLWGAQLAHMVLSDPKLYPSWLAEIKAMSDRLRSVREKLFDTVSTKLKTPGNWAHLKRGTGMYCVLLLPPAQLEALMQKRRVYLLRDGCLSLGCLDVVKIESLARSLDHVVRESLREAEEQQAQSIAMELALQAATEQQARHEAEEAAAVAAAEAAAAQAEDTMLIEASIQTAMEAQRVADEEERRREEEQRLLEEQVRKAAERAEIARQAELILASI